MIKGEVHCIFAAIQDLQTDIVKLICMYSGDIDNMIINEVRIDLQRLLPLSSIFPFLEPLYCVTLVDNVLQG